MAGCSGGVAGGSDQATEEELLNLTRENENLLAQIDEKACCGWG
jgi:hypothetical protein